MYQPSIKKPRLGSIYIYLSFQQSSVRSAVMIVKLVGMVHIPPPTHVDHKLPMAIVRLSHMERSVRFLG